MNHAQVEREIEAKLAQLEELVDSMPAVAARAANAEADYRTAFAKARLRAKVDSARVMDRTADDMATTRTEDLYRERMIATNLLLVQREALNATRAALDGLRTISASHRAGP